MSAYAIRLRLECGPMPNIDGALCKSSVILFLVPRRKVWLTAAADRSAVQ